MLYSLAIDWSPITNIFDSISNAADVVTDPLGNFYDTVVNFLTSIYNYLVTLATRGLEILQFTVLFQNVTTTVSTVIWAPIGMSAAFIIGIGAVKLIAGWGNT